MAVIVSDGILIYVEGDILFVAYNLKEEEDEIKLGKKFIMYALRGYIFDNVE